MYLHVNPTGYRHLLFQTFRDVVLNMKSAIDEVEYRFSVLNPGCKGSYDMIMSRVTETVSRKQFIKARFIYNPTNIAYNNEDIMLFFPKYSSLNHYDIESFDALSLLIDSILVNGYLPIDAVIPDSILDDFTALTATLDDFFKKDIVPSYTDITSGLDSV